MKFRTTLILLLVFIVLLALVYFFEIRGKGEQETEEKLVDLSSDEVRKIVFKRDDESITFRKEEEDWLITEPLEAKADKYEVNQLVDNFCQLGIERVVEETAAEEDLKKYEIPQKEIILHFKAKAHPVRIKVGMENPLDNTFFAQREGEPRIVLIPSHLKTHMEKSVFDFRKKDIFSFDTDQVKSIRVRAKERSWRAQKKEDEWFLKKPLESLAETSKINSILNSLSSLKAKEFISEKKKEEEIKKYGLDRPDYEIHLILPAASQEATFFLQEKEDKLYATTSLSSKIIAAEDTILSDLEKQVQELRDKEVAHFYSWEADKLHIKKAELDWMLKKDDEGNWRFESPVKEEADKSKVETFIRKIESLEADEIIDPPLKLKHYGLDSPQAEVKIWTEEDEEKGKEINILVGSEIMEKVKEEEEEEEEEVKRVFIKNVRFDYIFKVEASFLDEFPQGLKDWKKAEEEKEK
ncbi:MAG: DUF4340 domain-containing protein [Candidatus Aminicenantes bacterium]